MPLVPSDGWDRRLITKFHDSAGTAEAWLEALDKGGMEQAGSERLVRTKFCRTGTCGVWSGDQVE